MHDTSRQSVAEPDARHISNGRIIPSGNYADQPFVIRTADGAWLCVMTVGRGREGEPGQHLVARRSTDQGRTWSEAIVIEPPDQPEASYSVMLKAASGRIYCFYNHNTDNLRRVRADSPPNPDGYCARVDTLGHFVFKYSDDHGRTWSPRRIDIPLREFAVDRGNPYGGKVKFFWNVGRPFVHDGTVYVPHIKVGRFGIDNIRDSEGCLLASPDLLKIADPAQASWQTLPDGDAGLRSPAGGGPIAEEHSFSVLSDGSFFCVYRSVDGYAVCSYSRDRGHTWEPPAYMTYADGRRIKNPRAANFAWKCANGRFLYWFHNHSGRSYFGRNPAWFCAGEEIDSPTGRRIAWGQPEIGIYDDDVLIRMSYPDLIEEQGRFFVTETQKHLARVHELPDELIALLWEQPRRRKLSLGNLVLDWRPTGLRAPAPKLRAFRDYNWELPDTAAQDFRTGFALDLTVRLDSLAPGQCLASTMTGSGQGWSITTTEAGTLLFTMGDGQTRCAWDCDQGLLGVGRRHRITAIIDGGPKLMLFVVDGRLCDGDHHRQYGWGRFSPHLLHANGAADITLHASVLALRVYDRAIRVSEALGNHRTD